MNTTPRAANQLRALDPADVTSIIDHLHALTAPDRASLIEVATASGPVRCFVASHKDGSLVLLAIVPIRQEVTS